MLQKGAVIPVKHQEGEFLSNIFLVPKKEGLKVVGQRPVINLKELNKFLVCDHFKIESLNCLKDILAHGDFMCKIDLKDAYFSVPLAQNSCKFVRFTWAGSFT